MRYSLLIVPALLAIAAAALLGSARVVQADHKDNSSLNGHPLIWDGQAAVGSCTYVDQCEMNTRTVNGQTIYLRLITFAQPWGGVLTASVNAWNSGTSDLAGFNVFTFDNSQTPYVEVQAAASSNEQNLCFSPFSHGCVLNWEPTAPAGRIFMYGPYLAQGRHKQSDLMHEMGHVLMNAPELYPAYNCSSIMGHSSSESAGGAGMCGTGSVSETLITVQSHDRQDYLDVYGVKDAPDATYVQMLGSGTLVHYFEGSWFGGNGKTLHQERYNWIDRSTSGVGGAYSFYKSPGRKVAYADDGNPENDSYAEVPGSGAEWCMKRRGRAGGIASNQPNYWGPLSRAYCIRQSYGGSGVFVASNRNDYVLFQVWNYSGAQINNVALLLNDNVTRVCDLASIPNNTSTYCVWYPGNSAGFVRLWYNWSEHGPIGYDIR